MTKSVLEQKAVAGDLFLIIYISMRFNNDQNMALILHLVSIRLIVLLGYTPNYIIIGSRCFNHNLVFTVICPASYYHRKSTVTFYVKNSYTYLCSQLQGYLP